MDRFGEGSRLLEICDSENLGMLLRMARRYRQPSFQALPQEQLALFLASFQGVAPRGESLDDLRERLEQLFGWSAPAAAWEEHLLPARMQPYRSEWLDSLTDSSDLIWFGSGQKRVSLAFREDLELFRSLAREEEDRDGRELDHLIPDRRGRYSFFDITEFSHLDSVHATDLLWKEAWKGRVTSDSFRTVRKGAMTGFTAKVLSNGALHASRRSGFNRWKVTRPMEGHWLRIDSPPAERDILEEEELVKDRIRQLFKRYGVIFRELLANELPPLQWRAIFRSLRLMELSGEVLSGYFFEGVSGPQFISPEAFRMLQEPLPQDNLFWVNATDPASLCGLGLVQLQNLPPRIVSTHLVYRGSRLVMISKRFGKSLDILAAPEDAHLAGYFVLFKDLLSREFKPLHKISVEIINGVPALSSPHAAALRQFGFKTARNTLELWKEF
jgi:ATP-dependent Lhr-like helicase